MKMTEQGCSATVMGSVRDLCMASCGMTDSTVLVTKCNAQSLPLSARVILLTSDFILRPKESH